MKTIAEQIKWNFETNGNLEIRDKNHNPIYFENRNGHWYKWRYDSNGNEIYLETFNGDWSRREYDSENNLIYVEDSDGYIINNRPKNEITIDVSGIENSGKSRVIFLLKKLLKEQKFNVQFDGGRDFDDESHFDEYVEKRFNDILENIKPITKIVIKESHTKPPKT